jgi:hypothetical protein
LWPGALPNTWFFQPSEQEHNKLIDLSRTQCMVHLDS